MIIDQTNLKTVLASDEDYFKQSYDLVVMDVKEIKTLTNSKTNVDFTVQKLLVSDGTDAVYLSLTPTREYIVGMGLKVKGAYIKKENGYWGMRVANFPKGSIDYTETTTVQPVRLQSGSNTPSPSDVKIDLKLLNDHVFNELYDLLELALQGKCKYKTAEAWYLDNQNKIAQLRDGGLLQ